VGVPKHILLLLAVAALCPARSVATISSSLFVAQTASAPVILDHPHVSGEILVRFDEQVAPETAERALMSAGASAARRVGNHGLYVGETQPTDEAMLSVMNALVTTPGVRYTEANYLGAGGGAPDDPHFSTQWHLEQTSDIDIDALTAWDFGNGPWQVTITIIDSGTRFDHPELSSQAWVNPGEVPGNSVDDDGNGYIDDVNGWDFEDDDNDPSAEHYHGILVTGVAVATLNNSFQVAGVSQNARYLPLKILDENNSATQADLIEALEYAADLGTSQVVNLSLIDFAQTSGLSDALNYAASRSVLVGCAGNDGPGTADSQYPGAHSAVFSVGWTDVDDTLMPDSSTGTTVDFSAPGSSIKTVSVFPPFLPTDSSTTGGCSIATPIVSGIASLVQSHCLSISAPLLGYYLNVGSVDLGPPGWDAGFGHGRVNAADTLQPFLAVNILCHGFENGVLSGWSSSVP
jgi:hypothetical protein